MRVWIIARSLIRRIRNGWRGLRRRGLRKRLGSDYRTGPDFHKASSAELKELRRAEIEQVNADIANMWSVLAELNESADVQPDASVPVDMAAAMTELRQSIVRDVEMRKRMVWYANFKARQTRAIDEPGWQKWLAGDSSDGPDITSMVPVAEESEPHVILRAIKPEVMTRLGKKLEVYPGLALLPSTHRSYPLKQVACHALGRLSRAAPSDNEMAKALGWDLTRLYRANDLSGRAGIESLCEPLLRGTRGKIETRVGDDAVVGEPVEFTPGRDVRITIDAELQARVQELLKHVQFKGV